MPEGLEGADEARNGDPTRTDCVWNGTFPSDEAYKMGILQESCTPGRRCQQSCSSTTTRTSQPCLRACRPCHRVSCLRNHGWRSLPAEIKSKEIKRTSSSGDLSGPRNLATHPSNVSLAINSYRALNLALSGTLTQMLSVLLGCCEAQEAGRPDRECPITPS